MLDKFLIQNAMLNTHILEFSLGICALFLLGFCWGIRLFKNKLIHLQGLAEFVSQVLALPTLFFSIIAVFSLSICKFVDSNLLSYLLDLSALISYFWVTFKLLIVSKEHLNNWATQANHMTLSIILPYIEKSLEIILILIMINVLLPFFNFKGTFSTIIDRAAQIFLIAMIGYFFYQLTNICEKLIVGRYISNNNDIFSARKINTQLRILKRFVVVLITLVTIAYILMLFDKVNNIGKGILTTAGIISAVGAFASQQSLSRIFAGLQIAFTQPVRIGDTVIVDNEQGTIEEITLFYIVVKLWDLRRLILPSDYFSSKGLQNLTRQSSQLLGTIFIYTDYTLPVEEVRAKFLAFLAESPLWDKKVGALHVTNVNDKSMEIRGLMSADNSGNLFELRCSMREKMMRFIVKNYPLCLSQSRTINNPPDASFPQVPQGAQ